MAILFASFFERNYGLGTFTTGLAIAGTQLTLTLTGTYDLPAGDFDFGVQMISDTFSQEIAVGFTAMQVIVGQYVDEQDCSQTVICS